MYPGLLQYSSSGVKRNSVQLRDTVPPVLSRRCRARARNISCRVVLPHCKHNLITSVTSPETLPDRRLSVPLIPGLFNACMSRGTNGSAQLFTHDQAFPLSLYVTNIRRVVVHTMIDFDRHTHAHMYVRTCAYMSVNISNIYTEAE